MFNILSICKGGGYVYARTSPIHPKANSKKLYPLHRILMENHLNRILDTEEHVHHIDSDRYNNDIANLQVMSLSDHAKHHKPKIKSIKHNCSFCFTDFYLKPYISRLRLKRNKTKKLYCSKYCVDHGLVV